MSKGACVKQTRSDIEAAIRQILKELFPDHDIGELKGDDDLVAALDLDSMAMIDLALEVERRLRVRIPNEDLERLTTIDAVTEYLVAQDATA
jgi:acyl carrier protein